MPYYWGEGDPGWNEEEEGGEHEHRLPKASQFRYSLPFHLLPPPESIGQHESVQFSDQIPPRPAFPIPEATPQTRSFLDHLLGRRAGPPAPAPRLTLEQQQEASAYRHQYMLALVVAALREIGVRRVYCRCDGGNDEGFAWLDHAETRSGERFAPDLLARRLAATKLLEHAVDAKLWHRRRLTRAQGLGDIADRAFASDCAGRLLGGGFGTGRMLLYGAFTVDLDACTIVDDRNAEPVVRNIDIEV
jgi:hypothetical protein